MRVRQSLFLKGNLFSVVDLCYLVFASFIKSELKVCVFMYALFGNAEGI